MRRLLQPTLILLVALVFTSCSGGYYSHLPRAKKVTAKNEVVEQKVTVKTEEIGENKVVSIENKVDADIELATADYIPEDVEIIVDENNNTSPVATKKSSAKSVFELATKPVKKVKEVLNPEKKNQTKNVANKTALLLIVLGLVLGALGEGAVAAIGGALVIIGVILLVLNIFGVDY